MGEQRGYLNEYLVSERLRIQKDMEWKRCLQHDTMKAFQKERLLCMWVQKLSG